MKQVLIDMIEIYQPKGIDWMGYALKRDNPYTFHHIKEARNGGGYNIHNGAILTHYAHCDLNTLDVKKHQYYRELNMLFKELNRTEAPPKEEYYEEVNHILVKSKSLLRYKRW